MVLLADTVGENIREIRLRRRLTQEGLAARVNVSRTTVVAWEAGRSSPVADDLPAIAKALGVRAHDLIDGIANLHEDLTPSPVTPQRGDGAGVKDGLNVAGRLEDLREPGVTRLPIFRWGSLGDPRDHLSAPDPDRLVWPPVGREALIGPNGFGVEVRGESMVGRDIRDGDVCWVNPDRPYRLGGIVLALVDDENSESGMVIKSYGHTEVGDCLLSEFASGKSPVVCRQFKIIGPVVWIERGFPPR